MVGGLLGPFLAVFGLPLLPMLHALDRPDGPLTARITGTLAYFIIIAPLCWQFGVEGGAIAFVIGNSATVAVMQLQLRREHRPVRSREAQPSI